MKFNKEETEKLLNLSFEAMEEYFDLVGVMTKIEGYSKKERDLLSKHYETLMSIIKIYSNKIIGQP